MITEHIDIRAEIARVQEEVVCFRDRCLPTFLGDRVHEVFQEEYCEWVREKIVTRAGSLSKWQGATSQLADLLPLGPLASSQMSRGEFKEYLFQEATPSFSFREGRIVWKIDLFVDRSLCSLYCPNLPESALDNPDCHPEVQRWLMRLPVDSTQLANCLCCVLPFLADSDPGFTKLALDPATWRNIVTADRDMSEKERAKLMKWIDGQVFSHWLNNSLLHTLGALASNQFRVIEDYLDHPYICGGYTHLMSHYLFAVLVEKVAILRQLSVERPELW